MNWLHLFQIGVTLLLILGGAIWYDQTRALKK
jgi:hypothetical protein